MIVRDWMTTQVEVVRPDDDVATVREVLRRRAIRQLPVIAADRLIGIVTDRDTRGVTDPATIVESIMSPSPMTTTPATPVEAAAAVLCRRKIGALPVMEGGRLVGIISESDLLRALVELCNVLDPTTVLEIDCDEDPGGPKRARQVIERHGGKVAWMTAVRVHGGRQRVNLRVRMPIGHAPERLLEEAGFTVTSCLMGVSQAL